MNSTSWTSKVSKGAAACLTLAASSVIAGAVATNGSIGQAALPQQTQVAATIDDFTLPGTQPGQLNTEIFSAQNGGCFGCHGNYNTDHEPYTDWAASMMGQAGRDPIFYATLAIANQDVNFGGEACLRCHAPGAWLDGRSTPTDGSALDPALGDLDGVTCHFCHRMVDPVAAPENPAADAAILAGLTTPPLTEPHTGSFIIDPDDVRRGPYELQNFFFHQWAESPFHRESLMCSTCHDVSNPLLELQTDGTWQLGALGAPAASPDKNDMFPVERTYSEWASSVFAQDEIEMGGRFGGDKTAVSSCQDCHMEDTSGTGCRPQLGPPVRDDLGRHTFSGANSWVLRAIRSLYPDNETGLTAQSVDDAIARNEAMLRASADVEAIVEGGDLRVRITNQGGHKLPTGYGEGRRMWIEVVFFDAGGNVVETRGGYDPITADLDEASTTVFAIDHGIDAQMASVTGLPVGKSLHFLLNNVTLKDNRIPARGYRSAVYAALGAEVIGASYEEAQYWAEERYALPAGATRAEVRLFHQTTSKEYAEFLRDTNVTDNTGIEAYQLWESFGKSAPVEMGLADVDLSGADQFAARPLDLGKLNSQGLRAEITFSGSASASGAGGTVSITGGTPGQLMLLFASPGQGSTDNNGGVYNVINGSVRSATMILDMNGEGQMPVSFTPANIGGPVVFQAFYRDPVDPFGFAMSNGLRVDVTP